MIIKFNWGDNQPLSKMLKPHMLTVTVRSVLKRMVSFIHKFSMMNFCINYKCYNMIGLKFQKKFRSIKQMHQSNVIFVITYLTLIFR